MKTYGLNTHWENEPTPSPSQEGSGTGWPVPLLGGVRGGLVSARFLERSSMKLLPSRASRLAIALLIPALLASTLFAAEERVVDAKALPRFPPVSPQDALNTFQLKKGFRL